MKKSVLLMAVILIHQFAYGSDSMPPLEKKVRWVWSQTLPFLKACLSSTDCHLEASENQFAKRIVGNERLYSADTIQFVSEQDRPDLFTSALGETHRLMVTGSSPGAPIYINSTRVLDSNSNLTIEAFFGLFAHELIHHLGVPDDAQRIPDQFGVKVTNIIHKQLVPIDLSDSSFQSFVLNMPAPNQAQFIQDFPNGLHPRFLVMGANQFISQEYANLAERAPGICSAGTLWYSQAQVSHVKETQDAGKQVLLVELKLSAQCFLKAQNALQEEISYITNEVLMSQGNIQYGKFFWDKYSADQSSMQGLQVISMNHATAVKAGASFEVEATVGLLYDYKIKACAGQITSPLWKGTKTGPPLVVSTTDCQILSNSDKQFHFKFKIQIPDHAPDGLQIKVNQVYLQTVENQYVMGRPSQAPLVQISSGSKSQFELKGIQFLGATKQTNISAKNAYYISRGQPIRINFQFSGTTQLIGGYFVQLINDIDRNLMDLTTPLVNESLTPIQSSVDNQGQLNVTASIDPLHRTPREIIQFGMREMVALTSDWNYLNVNLEPYEYYLSVVVPR